MMEHSVALVDDHHLVRAGLAATIQAFGGFRVVMEAANGAELVEALATRTGPEIAIVDLSMPIMDGFETIAWLREHAPEVKPLALTFDASDDAMLRAVRAGARGFLLKNAHPTVLRNAMVSLVQTGYYYTDELVAERLSNISMRTRQERERQEVLDRITAREMEFLRYVCSEDEPTYGMIAESMGVHRRTVDNYRISLFEKFSIRSKTGLVLFAMRWRVLEPGGA